MAITTKSDKSPAERYYTDAPTNYDWGWTTTLIENVGVSRKGNPVRLVEISDGFHADHQVQRYGSGLHFAFSEEEYNKQVGLGWITPTPDKAVHSFRTVVNVEPAIEDEAKNKKLRPYVLNNRPAKATGDPDQEPVVIFESIGGSYDYRLTVKGKKDQAEATLNRLVSEIEAILKG